MTTVAQHSFAGGEAAPALYARVDIDKYRTMARQIRNLMVMRHGGTTSRPGLKYICEVKDSSKTVRLIPFIFNADQTYVLEFGNLYMRVIRNGAQVTVSGVTAWSNATAYVIGDLASEGGVNYYCILGHTNQQPPNATYWYPLTDDIYEIPTPYVEADLPTLKFIQSADVITFFHPTYAVRELARTAHTDWVLSLVTFAPSQAAPTNPAVSGSAGTVEYYKITAVNSENFEESLPTSQVGVDAAATSGAPRTVSWTAAAGAGEYNIYKTKNGVFGFIGNAVGTSFVDNGIAADSTETPPSVRNPFSTTGDYPSTGTYYQQRLGAANTNNNPEGAEFSKSGNFKNFTKSYPLQDDDAISYTLVGNQVNAIKHMITLGNLINLTSGGEWVIKGDVDGALLPTDINAQQISYYGSADLRPLIIGNSALFLQARSSIVRDLVNDSIDGFTSDDLSIFSAHLFELYTIVDWDYQQIPHSILWAVRSDGVLLGFTYVRRQQLFAWHRHDTDGLFENACSVPEGTEDSPYFCIKRTIDGSTKRYIEKMYTRQIDDIKDLVLLDSAISYDGRNTGATTMTLSGGTNWTYDETLTLTASAGYFVAGDVGNEIHLTGPNGEIIRFEITGYTGTTIVTGKPHMTVPAAMRSVATLVWGKAVDEVSGLEHLEDKSVAIFADGFVVANPNNDSYDVVTVASGAIALSKCYVTIHIGLPYFQDLETLDIDTINGETLADKKKMIGKVSMYVNDTRGVFAGGSPPSDDDDDPKEGLYEFKARNAEPLDLPVALKTDVIDINIATEWNSNGRVFIRQIDPLPMSILSVMPGGFIPFKG